MVYGTCNELVTGAFVNQRSHHNGGPHMAGIRGFIGRARSMEISGAKRLRISHTFPRS